jgi:hypothetical protein
VLEKARSLPYSLRLISVSRRGVPALHADKAKMNAPSDIGKVKRPKFRVVGDIEEYGVRLDANNLSSHRYTF